jgi:homocysteine S-methyltransferase
MPSAAASPIAEALAAQRVLILDGALATELERRGADLNDPLWSAKCLLERPDIIREVHLDYLRAGADIVTTATYQATFEGFGTRGIGQEGAARSMRDAVSLAIGARNEFWSEPLRRVERRRPLVAASVGPYGAMLADGSEYRGRYAISDRSLAAFHRPRLEVLAGSGADLFAFETIPCLREALVLSRLLEEQPAMTAWISFSCRDGAHDCEGELISDCAAALRNHPQIAAVGVNCTRPEHVQELLCRMRVHADKPLIAYPNSGEAYDAATKSWGGACAMKPANQALAWYQAGARLIGGCCRTTPQDIGALRALRAQWSEK